MAKVPAFAKAFAGGWRIVEADVWDNEFLDLVEQAHITFSGSEDGEIVFSALTADLGVRYPRTARKWHARFLAEGIDGLKDRSSRPHRLHWPTPAANVA